MSIKRGYRDKQNLNLVIHLIYILIHASLVHISRVNLEEHSAKQQRSIQFGKVQSTPLGRTWCVYSAISSLLQNTVNYNKFVDQISSYQALCH